MVFDGDTDFGQIVRRDSHANALGALRRRRGNPPGGVFAAKQLEQE
jgi:hypothetical protein